MNYFSNKVIYPSTTSCIDLKNNTAYNNSQTRTPPAATKGFSFKDPEEKAPGFIPEDQMKNPIQEEEQKLPASPAAEVPAQ